MPGGDLRTQLKRVPSSRLLVQVQALYEVPAVATRQSSSPLLMRWSQMSGVPSPSLGPLHSSLDKERHQWVLRVAPCSTDPQSVMPEPRL